MVQNTKKNFNCECGELMMSKAQIFYSLSDENHMWKNHGSVIAQKLGSPGKGSGIK